MIKAPEVPLKSFGGPAYFFGTTANWTCPASGWYRLSLLGAGGSGGAIFRTTNGGAAGGGGGGGFCSKEVFIVVGATLSVIIGAGGLVNLCNVSGSPNVVADGGASYISGTGISMMVSGGTNGGTEYTTGGGYAAGGSGGQASGGDINFAGGDGGYAMYTATKVTAGGGGGAGSPYGVGGRGGYATINVNAAAGGGAILYQGFDALVTGKTHGGGTGGTPTTASGTGPNRAGLATCACVDGIYRSGTVSTSVVTSRGISFESLIDPFACLTGGSGAGGTYDVESGPGAGGSGAVGATPAKNGNICGGGGGCVHTTAACASGTSVMGGGSGGAASLVTSATAVAGGSGFAVIERIG